MNHALHTNYIDIAIGLLMKQDKVCLSLRQSHQHLAGLWEFPGGKIEAGEQAEQALTREFKEELGVDTDNWQHLITVPWHYEKVSVRLQVFQTEDYQGDPYAREGQQFEWCPISQLAQKSFPEANKGILTALNLPDLYLSIGSYTDAADCIKRFQQVLNRGVKLAQFKSKGLAEAEFIELASALSLEAQQAGAKLMLNSKPELLGQVPHAAGVQLSSTQAQRYQSRPIDESKLLAVSVHTMQQLEHALKIGADMILISPVNYTAAHQDMAPLGWEKLQHMIADIPVPVYALGGMSVEDITSAQQSGAQGVMLTKGVWPSLT